MGKISSYPAMTALQGPELILGDQSGATGTTTPTAVAAYMAGLTTTPVLASYARTAAEIAAGVTPTNYAYPPGDVRRYGGDPTGVNVSTGAFQSALNVALQGSSDVYIGQNCNYLIGAVSVTVPSTSGTSGLRIIGSSVGGSRLTLSGTPAALVTIQGATPTGAPAQANFVMENVTIYTPTTQSTVTALTLLGIAWWRLVNVYISGGFGVNLSLSSALTGTIEGGAYLQAATGIYIRPDGTGASCNLLRIQNAVIAGNTTWGIDADGISGGSGCDLLAIEGCDLEENGTSGNFSTGGLHLGSNMSGSLGFSLVKISRCWFESNLGQTIQIDAQAAGSLFVSFRDTQTLSEDAGHAINAPRLNSIEFDNCLSPSPSATWTLAATHSAIKNSLAYVLSDTSTIQVYENVSTTAESLVSSPQPWAPYVYKGATASTASGTAVTAVTLPNYPFATYLVSATILGAGSADYSATAVVSVAGGSVATVTMIQSPTRLTISASGLAVQLTQTSGAAQVINYSVNQIA